MTVSFALPALSDNAIRCTSTFDAPFSAKFRRKWSTVGPRGFERENLSGGADDRRSKKGEPAQICAGIDDTIAGLNEISNNGTFARLKSAKPVNITLNVLRVVAYLDFKAKLAADYSWSDRIRHWRVVAANGSALIGQILALQP